MAYAVKTVEMVYIGYFEGFDYYTCVNTALEIIQQQSKRNKNCYYMVYNWNMVD